MKKIKITTFAILVVMTVAVLTACSSKDPAMDQTTNPSTSQSTSGTNQGTMNESGESSTGTPAQMRAGPAAGLPRETGTGLTRRAAQALSEV